MAPPGDSGPILGIDLGTTNTCAAVWQGDGPVMITGESGELGMPSVVAKTTDGRLLTGLLAFRQAVTNPKHTIFGVKRLIGRPFDHPMLAEQIPLSPFEIVAGPRGDARVMLRDDMLPPSAICAEILAEVKDRAQAFLGEPVRQAVITVPAYFTDSQRAATRDAGKIAGLEVLRMINEPTAAALAYGHDRQEGRVLVFDLGGGTFDVSIVDVRGGMFRVVATGGDTRLGGEDFDDRVVNLFLHELRDQHEVDLSDDANAMQRLREEARNIRHELSEAVTARVNLPFLSALEDGSPIHLEMELPRARLENLIEDLVGKAMQVTQQTLDDCELSFDDIDEILLVGGTTRTPLVRKRLKVLSGRDPSQAVDPDNAVAMGAAVQAAAFSGLRGQILLMDVTAHDLGIQLPNDRFETLVKRNTPIPAMAARSLTTSQNDQEQLSLVVRQGRSKKASENELMGLVKITGLHQGPRGSVRVNLDFSMDADGTVNLFAQDAGTGNEYRAALLVPSGLDREEMAKLKDGHKVNRLRSHAERIKQTSMDALRFVLSDVRLQRDQAADEQQAERIARILLHGEDVLARGEPAEADRFVHWLEASRAAGGGLPDLPDHLTATFGDQLSAG